MSGHSHWHTIRFKKGAADAKKSKLFSKFSREISVSARDGGGDLDFNPKLRSIVEKARSLNMPNESIERAIKKGTGEIGGQIFEEFIIEGYGPNNTALIITGITDNKNRSLPEIRKILNEHGGKIVDGGAIKWMFEKKGVIATDIEDKDKEESELSAIEAGAENIKWDEDLLIIYTKVEDLEQVKKAMEEHSFKIDSSSLEWVAKEEIEVDENTKQKCQNLFESLDDHDDVQDIFSNIKNL